MNTKRSISFKVVAVFLVALLTTSVTNAQSVSFPFREMSSKLYGSSLTAGTNIVTVANDQRAVMLANPSTFPANVKYKANYTLVKLSIDHAATTVPSAPYIYKMAYTIQGAPSMTSSTLSFSASDTMIIAYNPDSLTAYQDLQVKAYPQLYDAKVTITGFYDMTSGTPVALPMPPPNKNFFIELAMQYQPYLMTHSVPGDMLLNASKVYTKANQLLTVSWTPNTAPLFLGKVTPAMYELEWTYVDSYAPDGTELLPDAVNYNFKNNATRIITDSMSYNIPVVYPKGYIVYRVRMVRVDNTNYKYPIYGVWSLANASGAVSSAAVANYFKILGPHSNDALNWNYTIHFAEGGKYKHVIGYFDGLLKNRQTITRFNTNPLKLLATENIYDFEGRPSITTLPTVIDLAGFVYQANVSNSSVTGLPYSPYDFDLKPAVCPDEPTFPQFTTASLANRYYSRLNVDTADMQKFVPQAEGFPFVHTQLSPGYADRVDIIGGAGPVLQVNKGHDTKNEYMQGDQPDLNNLFGINAGYASFYTKTVSKDPNGQNAMSVKDYKGRQILTSLIGASVDTSQIAIIFNDEVPLAAKARENKLADPAANMIVGSEKKYSGSFYMDYDAMSNIKYEYGFKPYMVCPAPGFLGLTVKCTYDYDVHDNCGIEVLHKKGVLGITGVSTIATPPPFAEDTNILLNKGKYTIRKTMTIADEDVAAAVDSFFNHTPNCLKTEDDFIREQVEKTKYPCAAIDPCGALKLEMMQELWTDKKYGHWYGDKSAPIPVFGDGNSIYDIPQSMPDGSAPEYRFQNDCVHDALDALVIEKYGKTYRHIGGPVLEVTEGGAKKLYDQRRDIVLIFKNEIYTGTDKNKIAEALLPLHPEYCKLLACYDDTLAIRLKALPDAATAIKYNMFYLDSIVKKDIDLRSRMMLPPFNYAHIDDSLRLLLGGRVRMDTLASQIAFCMNMDADVFDAAKDFFRNDIINFNFPTSRIKDVYFDNQRNMYLANREKYLSMSKTAAGSNCPPCDSFARMKLKPEPVIIVEYGPDGSFASGPDGIMSLFSDTSFATIKAWVEKTKGMPVDTAGVAAMGDSAAAIVYRADSILCSVAADSIVSKLANCFGAGVSTSRFRDSLIALVRRKEVKNGIFFPDQVRRAIVTSGLSLNDLCHPYLVSYDYYDETFGGRGNCNSPSFYTAAAEFFNEPAINTPLKDASTVFSITTPAWPATNFFAMKIDAGLNGGSGSIKMAAQYRAYDSIYTCSFFKTGSDTVQISFRSPKVIRRGLSLIPFLAVPGTDSIVFNKMTCIFDDPTASAEGHVGRYMFKAEIRRVEAIGGGSFEIQTGQFLGWNNGKVVMNEDGGNPLSAYVPCTQFRDQFNAFKDSMTLYGGFAQDHPLFYRSMRNFMNYNLKKVLSVDQYTRFLNSCALSDSMRIPMYGGYGRISFPTGTGPSYANFAAFQDAIALSDDISLVSSIDYKNGGTETVILDYRMIPFKKIKYFNDKLLASGGQVKAAPAGIVGRLWLPAGSAAAGFISGTAFTLSAATNIDVRLSPYLPDWEDYDMYDVLATAPTPLQLASGIEQVNAQMFELGMDGFWLPNSYAATNRDYRKNNKQDYLHYVYSMQGLSAAKVLDTLQEYFIQQQVPAFSSTSVNYRNPENPYRFTDLYYTDNNSHFPGYDTVAHVLNYATTVLGSNRIFMPLSANKINVFGDTGSAPNLIMYRCADGLYWYRYFGKDNKLFNIFIRVPEYIYQKQHPGFNFVRIIPAVGDTASSVFNVMITIPGSLDTILARGTTNFNIAWAQKLTDVLMGNETNFSKQKAPPLSGELGAEPNCEQKLLANDVYTGKIEYYNYITKYKEDLLAAFRYHVMNQVGEKLWIEYIDMRFGTTLYAYDRAGNLIQTVPPEGVKKIDTATAKKIDSLRAINASIPLAIPNHKKATIYEYNTANRPWKEITPDAGTKLLYYDYKGNVLLSQSQRQRDDVMNYYTYFLYDGQNRLTETGQVSWNDSCPSFDPKPLYRFQQGQYIKNPKPFSCACENLADSVWEYCGPTNTDFYDDNQFNAMIRSLDRQQVVYTVYDSAFVSMETRRNQEAQENLRNRIGANMYYLAVGPGLPGSNFDHATHYSYDAAGNIKTLVQDFPQLESFKQRYKRMDYDYDLLSGKVNMISYNRGFPDQFFQRYAYDADNRLTKAETSHDGFIWKRDAEYTYYQHGPLARVSLGDQRVQGIDYAYTLQGWLKSINGDLADTLSDMGGDGRRSTITPRDVYATTLDYFAGDYKPVGFTPLSRLATTNKNLYNGNIARQSTDVAPFGGLTTAYTYDQMNRLRKATYAKTRRDSVLQFNTWYASSYRYDMDGNLRNLMRKQGSGLTMDSLYYRYNDSGINNKVKDLLDFSTFNTAGVKDIRAGLGGGPGFPRIFYDGDGNVINDFTGGIEQMEWNIYGKASRINPMDGPSFTDFYLGYDALGHRTYKRRIEQVDSGNLHHHTFYVREASGNILAEYNMLQDYAFQDIVKVIWNTRVNTSWGTWVGAIGDLGYTLDPAFSGYVISRAGASSLLPIGHYLAANPAMRSQFVSGGFGVLTALCRYSKATGKYPVADALRTSMSNPNTAPGTVNSLSNAMFGNPDPNLRRHALVQVAQMVPDLYKAIVQQNQLTIATPADSTNLFNIMYNTAQSNLPYYASQLNLYRQQSPTVLNNWLNAITADSLYTLSSWYTQSGYTTLLQNTLVNFGDQAATNIAVAAGTDKRTEGLYGFASWWPNSASVLNSLGYSSGSLSKVSYFNDPVTYLSGLTDYSIVDTALSLVGYLDFVDLTGAAGIPVTGGGSFSYSEPEIKLQSISLGNHHLYGSSRLGINNYFPAQYRNIWNFRSGLVDTSGLSIAMPWYSYACNDLIDTGKVSPWGNGLSRSATAQHLLGQKQYEITSQLGNVHATLSDKRFVKRTPLNVRDYFNAAIVSAYDYYPYGMLMPGRYVSDTTPVCVTSTQMRLMPKKTVNNVLPLATVIAPALPGTVGSLPGKTVFGQGGGLNIEVPVTAAVPINVTVNLSYIYRSFVTVEVSEAAGSGRRILASRNYTYPLSSTFPVTPSGTNIRIRMMMMSSFVTAPPGGLFTAAVATAEKVTYEPQPVLVTLCSSSDDKYEFGYNGQMKMNEVAGVGNWNTAEFWEYGTRSAHRANLDPVRNPSESPYAVFNSNPILNSDVNGDTPDPSTHTASDGSVKAVYNDGDNGVYQHKDLPKKYAKQDGDNEVVKGKEKPLEKLSGGKKIGETEYWDEFADLKTKAPVGILIQDSRKEASWDHIVTWMHNDAMKHELKDIADMSKLHKKYDLKNNDAWSPAGPMTGRMLNGKWATGRSAGNFLAGWNGATGTMLGQKISGETYLKMAGALNVGKFSKMNAIKIGMFGTSYGKPPYYGEDEYSGRRIVEGLNFGNAKK